MALNHIGFLNDLIAVNTSLEGSAPLNIVKESGHQRWINGRLDELILSGIGLTDLPESICNIYSDFSVFDISTLIN